MADPTDLCPDDTLLQLTELAAGDTRQGLRRAEALLATYAQDPRLYFLKGSLLAALQRYDEAAAPMQEAIEIAPGFHIARFQLGLLHLTSGSSERAAEIWRPLSDLDETDALRLFAEGLQHMARDAFPEAERLLREGMARNLEHPLLNHDMQMVLDRMREQGDPPAEDASSQAHWLLQVSASKPTKH